MDYRSHILIVDDSMALLEQAEEILGESYQISVAASGKQALRFFSKGKRTDLILLDILMPEMDGYETLKQIRKIEGCQDIPVIFLTSLDDEESELHGLLVGASDYITKPFNPAILAARVELRLRMENQLDEKKLSALAEPLTGAELKVAKLLAKSYSNEEIAKELHYALDTVKKIVSKILDKLEIKSRKEIKKYIR